MFSSLFNVLSLYHACFYLSSSFLRFFEILFDPCLLGSVCFNISKGLTNKSELWLNDRQVKRVLCRLSWLEQSIALVLLLVKKNFTNFWKFFWMTVKPVTWQFVVMCWQVVVLVWMQNRLTVCCYWLTVCCFMFRTGRLSTVDKSLLKRLHGLLRASMPFWGSIIGKGILSP